MLLKEDLVFAIILNYLSLIELTIIIGVLDYSYDHRDFYSESVLSFEVSLFRAQIETILGLRYPFHV